MKDDSPCDEEDNKGVVEELVPTCSTSFTGGDSPRSLTSKTFPCSSSITSTQPFQPGLRFFFFGF
ncbi:hypothetical protein BCR39DRAFT_540685, partial [Naematelia encephala]